MRATVNSYRELSLAGELARATNVLTSAGIRADLPLTVEIVDPELRELFRLGGARGVTNIVRHAHASHCRVVLSADSIEVADDGIGLDSAGDRRRSRLGGTAPALSGQRRRPHHRGPLQWQRHRPEGARPPPILTYGARRGPVTRSRASRTPASTHAVGPEEP